DCLAGSRREVGEERSDGEGEGVSFHSQDTELYVRRYPIIVVSTDDKVEAPRLSFSPPCFCFRWGSSPSTSKCPTYSQRLLRHCEREEKGQATSWGRVLCRCESFAARRAISRMEKYGKSRRRVLDGAGLG